MNGASVSLSSCCLTASICSCVALPLTQVSLGTEVSVQKSIATWARSYQ